MKYSSSLLVTAFTVANVFSRGVADSVKGANGVEMRGLSVADQTPRDCATPPCGSEANTSAIHNRELGTNKATGGTKTSDGTDGTTCDASVGGANNLCARSPINGPAPRPYGGSIPPVPTQKPERRAIENNLRKRNFARALINKRKPDAVSDALAALEATGSATKAEDGLDLSKRLAKQEDRDQAEIDKEVEEEDRDIAAGDNQKRELSKRLAKQEDRDQAEIDKEVEEEDRDIAAGDNQKRDLSKRLAIQEDRDQAEIDKEVEEEDRDIAAGDNQKRELSKRLTEQEDREQAEIDKEVEEEDRE